MADLPANVNYGTVTGKFLLAVGDSNDVGSNPDAVPAQGTVKFTPSPSRLLDVSASPPVTIIPQPITCTLDAAGVLVDPQGNPGVKLVATDDPDLNPLDWTYTVDYDFTGPPKFKFKFSIEVPMDTTTDLTPVTPVPSSEGTAIIVGPQGPAGPPGNVLDGTVVGTTIVVSMPGSVWGIDSFGNPYHDPAGVLAADRAFLTFDTDTELPVLIHIGGP